MRSAKPTFPRGAPSAKRLRRRILLHPALACGVLALVWTCKATAEPVATPVMPERRAFALVMGVNQSVDVDLPPLVYADDDAVRYYELFLTLGARTYLLSRPDTNTRQVFPDVAAEARQPRAAELWQTVAEIVDDVAQARRAGAASVLYIVYAGHGNAQDDGHAYITLEDARIDGEELGRRLVDAVGADQTHVIIDACHSYYLAYERGPGGKRREAHGFSEFRGLGARANVGLLLSTSSARESHEWEGFQAGVFSHEIRSGLLGAADVDRDGRVSYPEIAAFVTRANQAIPNERYRPDVYARPPSGETELVDLRAGLGRTLTIDREARAGHYYLEDELGNRLADFHNGAGQTIEIIRPPRSTSVYLHRLADDREFQLRPAPDHLVLSQLKPSPSRSRPRGAAQHAFSLLFSLPFDQQVVGQYALSSADQAAPVQNARNSVANPPSPGGNPSPDQPAGYRYGYHLHDKLYLRLYAGAAYFSSSEMIGIWNCPGCSIDRIFTRSGLGVGYGGSVGRVVVRNLILYVELVGAMVPDAKVTLTDRPDEKSFVRQLAFGPGAALYVDSLNLHLSSTLTFPKAWFGNQEGNIDFGVGLNLMAGKEWWVSANWGIGVALQAHFASMVHSDCCSGYWHASEIRFNTRTLALLLSATYN